MRRIILVGVTVFVLAVAVLPAMIMAAGGGFGLKNITNDTIRTAQSSAQSEYQGKGKCKGFKRNHVGHAKKKTCRNRTG